MKVVVQRALKSSVIVNNKVVGEIPKGLVLLVGFTNDDNQCIIEYIVEKIINLRIFDDEIGVMNKSVIDIGGEILSISQFTLYASTNNGRRPSYKNALNSDKAQKLYNYFNQKLKEHVKTKEGIFGSEMKVNIINDGPVTIILEKEGN